MNESHGKDPDKRHRHDIGDVAHGPESAEQITRAIQGLLGLCIAATLALLLYTLI